MSAAAVAARSQTPYKGLSPFGDSEEDALLFFGREREREVIVANLLASRLTVLYGPSGVGKSSVLRAGAARRLRSVAPDAAVVVHDAWSGDPLRELQTSLRAELGDVPAGSASLADALTRALRASGKTLYLVLDQFEESFLYAAAERVADELPELLERPGLPVHVLISIREDALAQLDVFKGRIPNLFANYLRLDRLDRAAAGAAILGPIEQHNRTAEPDAQVRIEGELVDAVLEETAAGRVEFGDGAHGGVDMDGEQRVEAPYLQLVMERLWQVELDAGSRLLRLRTFRELGGAAAIVRDHLERALEALAPAEKDLAARIFNHLVTPSGTKIAHRVGDLVEYSAAREEELAPVLSALGRQRILRAVDDGGAARYEIFHDVLAGAVLAWRTQRELERQRHAAERRHRRLTLIAAVAVVFAAAMAGVTVYALTQRSEARHQAAIATDQRRAAQKQAAIARHERARAEREATHARAERREAKHQAAIARTQGRRATRQAAIARRERRKAQEQARVALHERGRAETEASHARAAQADAEHQTRVAQTQRQEARRQARLASARGAAAKRAAARARRQARRARAGEFAAQAITFLTRDPARSLRAAVAAAALERSQRVEEALRQSLLAIRLRAVLPGGGGPVTAVFSRDGTLVATAAARGGGVRLFRRADGRFLHRLAEAGSAVSVAIGSDNRLVAAGGRGGGWIWSVDTGALIRALTIPGQTDSVALTPDERLLLTAGSDGAVRVWDTGSGLLLHTFTEPRGVRGISLSPDGALVLAFSSDRVSHVYDVREGRLVADLEHQGEVTDGHFSPTGDTVVTTGRRNVYVWNVGTWTRRFLFEGSQGVTIRAFAYSLDGSRIVTVANDGLGRVWRTDRGTREEVLSGHAATPEAAAFGPDGTLVVTGSRDHTARVYSLPRVGALGTQLAGHTGAVTAVAFAPDGGAVLTASTDGTARLWDPSGDPVTRLVGRHEAAVTSLVASSNSRLVVSGGSDGTARIWRTTGGGVRTLPVGGHVVYATFDRAGARVLTWDDNGFARLWNAGTGRLLASFPNEAPVTAAAVSPDGRRVVTAGADGVVRIWSSSGTLRRVLRHGAARLTVAAVSPDGALLATGDDAGVVRLWGTRTGAALATLRGHEARITALAFSPDGRRLATASADAVAAIWAARTGKLEAVLEGHEQGLTSVAFSPNGRLLVTASADGGVRTWSVSTGTLLNDFSGHVAVVAQASFSPDGRWIVTAGPTAAGLWRASDGTLLFFVFVRGSSGLRAASFTPDGRWIVVGAGNGDVRSYRCGVCGRQPELVAVAKARLAALARQLARARQPR